MWLSSLNKNKSAVSKPNKLKSSNSCSCKPFHCSIVPLFHFIVPLFPLFHCFYIVLYFSGALCIIASGTTAQPLVATLFQLIFLLLVLKAAPYDSDGDDQSSFVSALTLCLTMLCGFAVMSNPTENKSDANLVGYVLIVISCFCLAVQVYLMVMEMDLSMLKKCRKKKKTDQNTTKVAPVKDNPVKENKLAADSARLKEIRLKHGASSAEYQAAAKKI